MHILKVALLTDTAKYPTRTHEGDAGFDIFVDQDYDLDPGETVDISTGIAVEFPMKFWGMLVGRSSTLRTHGLSVNMGVIDPGYRGELFVNVHNPVAVRTDSDEIALGATHIRAGWRLAQLILIPNVAEDVLMYEAKVSEFSPSTRGESGFGSTGT